MDETIPEQLKALKADVEALKARPASAVLVHCGFCGKSQRQVERLVAGLCVCICNECVDLCAQVLADHQATKVDTSSEAGS